jgi:hypothetical protein
MDHRIGLSVILALSALAPLPARAQQPAGTPAAHTSPAPRRAAAKTDNPVLSAGTPVTTWFSLGPQREDFAASYNKDEVTGSLRANESITVYARRHLDVPEDNRPTTLGEAWNSPAAQAAVPALGSGCTKYTVCVDPGQKGLFSSIFGN